MQAAYPIWHSCASHRCFVQALDQALEHEDDLQISCVAARTSNEDELKL